MTRLPPYRPHRRCPKCQHVNVATTYHPGGGSDWDQEAQAWVPTPEHQERTCLRCGYRWDEAVAQRTRTRRKS